MATTYKRLAELRKKDWSRVGPFDLAMVTMTPGDATKILNKEKNSKNGFSNRKADRGKVRQWMREIEEGRWQDNCAPIVFGKDGHLYNGSHRLEACIALGESINLMVARGAKPELANIFDTGKSRTAWDIGNMRGMGITRNEIALTKWFYLLDHGSVPNPTFTHETWLTQLEKYRDEIKTAQLMRCGERGTMVGAVFAWASRVDGMLTFVEISNQVADESFAAGSYAQQLWQLLHGDAKLHQGNDSRRPSGMLHLLGAAKAIIEGRAKLPKPGRPTIGHYLWFVEQGIALGELPHVCVYSERPNVRTTCKAGVFEAGQACAFHRAMELVDPGHKWRPDRRGEKE